MTLATASATGKSIAVGVARDPRAADLPTLRLPYNTPAFRREDYERQPQGVYGDLPMQTGSARRRRRYLAAPEDISCSLEMNLEQAQAFHAWYEGPLKTGQEYFAAEVANAGPGTLWWKTRLVEPYVGEYLGGLWWKATLKLRVYGVGSYSAPEASDLKGGVAFDFFGTGELTVGSPLSGGVVFDLALNTAVQALVGGVNFELLNNVYSAPPSVGEAIGSAAVSGVGTASVFEYHVNGISTVVGVGRTSALTVAASSGGSVVSGIVAQQLSIGMANGSSTVLSAGNRLSIGVGTATGVAAALGKPPDYSGSAAGTSAASAVGVAARRSTAAAAGTSAVSADVYVPPPTWQARTFSTGLVGGQGFIGGAYSGSPYYLGISVGRFFTSYDNSTWTTATAPLSSGGSGSSGVNWLPPVVTGSGFVIISNDYNTCLLSSDGGVTWGLQGTLASTGWTQLLFDGTRLIAFNSTTKAVAYSSSTGATWTAGSTSSFFPGGTYFLIATLSGTVFAFNQSGNYGYYSTNGGSSWSSITMPSGPSGYIYAAYNGSNTLLLKRAGDEGSFDIMSTARVFTLSRNTGLSLGLDPAGIYRVGTRMYVPRTGGGGATPMLYTDNLGVSWSTEAVPASTSQGHVIGTLTSAVMLPFAAAGVNYRVRV